MTTIQEENEFQKKTEKARVRNWYRNEFVKPMKVKENIKRHPIHCLFVFPAAQRFFEIEPTPFPS